MAAIKEIFVKCGHCGTEFPSPIFIGDQDSFESGSLYGNRVQCPGCGEMISCNKENMRYTLADKRGGFVGNDYSGNKPSTAVPGGDTGGQMKFKGQKLTGRVELDGSYEQCQFKDVDLVYRGAQVRISDCSFENIRFTFDGPAQNTVQFLAALYVSGFKQFVEPTLEKIRTGKI